MLTGTGRVRNGMITYLSADGSGFHTPVSGSISLSNTHTHTDLPTPDEVKEVHQPDFMIKRSQRIQKELRKKEKHLFLVPAHAYVQRPNTQLSFLQKVLRLFN